MKRECRTSKYGNFTFLCKDKIVVGEELKWSIIFEPSVEMQSGCKIKIIAPAFQHQRSEEYFQTYDFWKSNYICAYGKNDDIKIDLRVEKIESNFDHILLWADSARVAVLTFSEGLKIGEEIEIEFGGSDRPWIKGYAPLSRVGEHAFKKSGTFLEYGLKIYENGRIENLDFFPKIKVIPDKFHKMTINAPSIVGKGQLKIELMAKDRYENPIFDYDYHDQSIEIINLENKENAFYQIDKGNKINVEIDYGIYLIKCCGNENNDDFVVLCRDDTELIYWGDTHLHSNLTSNIRDNDGGAKPSDVYEYAKYVSKLDFVALSEQTFTFNEEDVNINKDTWKQMGELNDKYYLPNEFTTISGFELHGKRGDTVCLFRDSLQKIPYPREGIEIIHEIWEEYKGFEFVTIPHLHRYCNGRPAKFVDNQDRKFEKGFSLENWMPSNKNETLVEIFSSQWGRFEHKDNPMLLKAKANIENNTVVDFLNLGKKWGFTSSSDGHDANPGFGGITGVFGKQNTREIIFDALKNRKTISTTHPRMIILFSINGSISGSIIDKTQKRKIELEVATPSPIHYVEIIRSGKCIKRITAKEHYLSMSYLDESQGNDYYYVRVFQEDKHIGWCSPVWVISDECNIF